MAKLTPELDTKIQYIARKHAGTSDFFDDCLQEGRLRVLQIPDGETESYYAQSAEYAIRDYLKKERLHQGREITNTIDEWTD